MGFRGGVGRFGGRGRELKRLQKDMRSTGSAHRIVALVGDNQSRQCCEAGLHTRLGRRRCTGWLEIPHLPCYTIPLCPDRGHRGRMVCIAL